MNPTHPVSPSHYNELLRTATERQRNAYRLTAWRHRLALHLAAKAQAAPTPLPAESLPALLRDQAS